MRRITVSVPDELGRKVKELSRETGLKVSQIFRMALEEHLTLHYPEEVRVKVRPTLLWRVKGRSLPRGPSPSLGRGRIGEYRFVGLDEIPL